MTSQKLNAEESFKAHTHTHNGLSLSTKNSFILFERFCSIFSPLLFSFMLFCISFYLFGTSLWKNKLLSMKKRRNRQKQLSFELLSCEFLGRFRFNEVLLMLINTNNLIFFFLFSIFLSSSSSLWINKSSSDRLGWTLSSYRLIYF